MGIVIAHAGHLRQPIFSQSRQIRGAGQGIEALVGADVAGGLLPADELLAGDQGQHVAGVLVQVDGLADDAPGALAHMLHLAGEEAQVGAAKAEAVARGLALAHKDVRAILARRGEDAQADGVGRHDQVRALGVDGVGQFLQPGRGLDGAQEVRVLDDDAGGVFVDQGGQVVQIVEAGQVVAHEVQGEALGVGAHDLAIFGVDRGGHDHPAALVAAEVEGHDHGLGGAGGPVIVAGVAHFHAAEVGDHGLIFVDGLQRALGHFGLIGGVGRVEFAPAEDIVHGAGDVVEIGPGAEETGVVVQVLVALGQLLQTAQHLHLAEAGGQIQGPGSGGPPARRGRDLPTSPGPARPTSWRGPGRC